MDPGRSIVEYFGDHERYRCGYCGGSDTNYSHGMWAHAMTVQDYQDLIDRGWRRSGKYCYKPTMKVTCCPHYTIRQDAPNFKISKSQKKVIKMVNRYLIHGVRKGDSCNNGDNDSAHPSGENIERFDKIVPSDINMEKDVVDKTKTAEKTDSESVTPKGDNSVSPGASGRSKDVDTQKTSPEKKQTHKPKEGSGADPSKPACRKAKDLRKERKLQKLAARGVDVQTEAKKSKEPETKTLEDYLNEPDRAEHVAHKLEIRLVRSSPKSEEFISTFKASHSVYMNYQMVIHKDPPSKPNEKQFTRFLVDSPLQQKKPVGGPEHGYGSFHQHYLLDGTLIAVGVVDVLPHSVSSVYLYYNPDYSFLSLGTYSALREIAFVRELQRKTAELRWYYMGYYIHSCPKMRYKGQYFPSYLGCPETYTWIPIDKCQPKLDASKYSRLSEDEIEDENGNIDLDKVLVLHDGEAMPYEVYRFLKPNANKREVKEYAGMTGRKVAERMLLFRK